MSLNQKNFMSPKNLLNKAMNNTKYNKEVVLNSGSNCIKNAGDEILSLHQKNLLYDDNSKEINDRNRYKQSDGKEYLKSCLKYKRQIIDEDIILKRNKKEEIDCWQSCYEKEENRYEDYENDCMEYFKSICNNDNKEGIRNYDDSESISSSDESDISEIENVEESDVLSSSSEEEDEPSDETLFDRINPEELGWKKRQLSNDADENNKRTCLNSKKDHQDFLKDKELRMEENFNYLNEGIILSQIKNYNLYRHQIKLESNQKKSIGKTTFNESNQPKEISMEEQHKVLNDCGKKSQPFDVPINSLPQNNKNFNNQYSDNRQKKMENQYYEKDLNPKCKSNAKIYTHNQDFNKNNLLIGNLNMHSRRFPQNLQMNVSAPNNKNLLHNNLRHSNIESRNFPPNSRLNDTISSYRNLPHPNLHTCDTPNFNLKKNLTSQSDITWPSKPEVKSNVKNIFNDLDDSTMSNIDTNSIITDKKDNINTSINKLCADASFNKFNINIKHNTNVDYSNDINTQVLKNTFEIEEEEWSYNTIYF